MAENPNGTNNQVTAPQDHASADDPVSAADQTTVETDGTENEDMGPEDRSWHPAFTEACRLLWDPWRLNLEFTPEIAVTPEPNVLDLLIVKKDPELVFTDRIGGNFREYNFIRFKSCADSFQIQDLYAEFGKAYAYFGTKSEEWLLDLNPENDVMLTVFCSNRPEDLQEFASTNGIELDEKDGIIQLPSRFLPVQIVLLGSVQGDDDIQYAPLKVFAKGAGQEDLRNLARFRLQNIPDTDLERRKRYETITRLLKEKGMDCSELPQ